MKTLKKFDVIIIVVLLLVSFVPFLIFKVYRSDKKANSYYANISVDGKPYESIELTDGLNKEFEVSTQYGHNTIQIKDGKVGIIAADCPDSICIYQGFIDSPNQQIVCLPHKLIITIDGAAKSQGADAVAK